VVEASIARLRELAQTMPRPGCDWEDRPRFDPPASRDAIGALERVAGFPLPTDLRAFFALTDAVVGISIHNGYWLGGAENLARGDFPRVAAGEPAVPVATDGGGNAFLLSASGRVWRWDHERGNETKVAESFTEFLERVAADWAAYISDTPG
jgi:cell wall assembly regulator SMI1